MSSYILVVDDHKLTCRMISSIIQNLGFDILTAHDGDEALSVMDSQPISVLV
ncbi:MAG: hypothetical protein HRU15_08220, partial [Planctomycetes bacterium]|nr:hypothetical protein [Planctomycetota bacterium]